jgi:hypothetical protein
VIQTCNPATNTASKTPVAALMARSILFCFM